MGNLLISFEKKIFPAQNLFEQFGQSLPPRQQTHYPFKYSRPLLKADQYFPHIESNLFSEYSMDLN